MTLKVDVVHLQRRPNATGNYSLEYVFEDLRRRLGELADIKLRIPPVRSEKLLKRIVILVYALLLRAQVVHINGDITFAGIVIARKRLVLTIHDCILLKNRSPVMRSVFRYLWMILPMRRAAAIVTISEAAKREILAEVAPLHFAIDVIYPAISERFVHSPKLLASKTPEILLIGTAPNKNVARVIEACSKLPCTLHVLGKLSPELERQLHTDRLTFRNSVGLDHDQVVGAYVQADIVVFASTYEGFGMPIVEAQLTGRPVVTSNIEPMIEVSGGAAVLVDPYDVDDIKRGIEKVMTDDVLRSSVIAKGLVNARRFDGEVTALQYLKIYQRVSKAQ